MPGHDRRAAAAPPDPTRERLVTAATGLFADRGFKRVTVREICRAARANVAAVNYHFGGKLGLYGAVVDVAVAAMRDTNQLAMDAGQGLPAEQALGEFVRVFLARVTGGRHLAWIHKLITRELEDPTGALDVVMRDVIRPRHAHLAGLLAAIMGLPPDDDRVFRAVASLQGQILVFARPLPPSVPDMWTRVADDVPAAADHVTAFTIAGARASAQLPRPHAAGGD
ncbi:MAG: CerR family C-terminal domain-containing protein [Vicinamibacterales bacterium]